MFSVRFYFLEMMYRIRSRHQQRGADIRWKRRIRISGSIIRVTLEREDWTVVLEPFSHIEQQVNYQAVEVDEVQSKWASVVCDEEHADSMTSCSETNLGGAIPTFCMDFWPEQTATCSFTTWFTIIEGFYCVNTFFFVKFNGEDNTQFA